MTKDAALNKLIRAIKAYSEITLAYIFGSSAAAAETGPSDIDIGIYVREGLGSETLLDMRLRLAEVAETLFERRADIVVLNAASPFLKYQVLKKGKLVFERKRNMDSAFRFRTMTEYFDSLMLQNFFYARMRKGERHD